MEWTFTKYDLPKDFNDWETKKNMKGGIYIDIRKEVSTQIKAELVKFRDEIATLTKKVNNFEASLSLLAAKYDRILNSQQTFKNDCQKISKEINELNHDISSITAQL